MKQKYTLKSPGNLTGWKMNSGNDLRSRLVFPDEFNGFQFTSNLIMEKFNISRELSKVQKDKIKNSKKNTSNRC